MTGVRLRFKVVGVEDKSSYLLSISAISCNNQYDTTAFVTASRNNFSLSVH
jgi:hypothetical protein